MDAAGSDIIVSNFPIRHDDHILSIWFNLRYCCDNGGKSDRDQTERKDVRSKSLLERSHTTYAKQRKTLSHSTLEIY